MKIKVTDVINFVIYKRARCFQQQKTDASHAEKRRTDKIMQKSRTKREEKYVECTNLLQLMVAK